MKILRLILFCCFMVLFNAAPLLGESIDFDATFAHGVQMYKDGGYEKAAEAFESILARGQESGALYYNLGNSYFRLHQLGEAILNYEKARRLTPRDTDLNQNYRYALTFVKHRVATRIPWWRLWITRHIEFYSLNEMAVICLVLLVFFAVAHICGMRMGSSRRKMVTQGVLGVLLLVYCCGTIFAINYYGRRAIVLEDTHVTFEPRNQATKHYDVYRGSALEILKEERRWMKVKRPDGKTGWVKAEVLGRI